MTCCSVNEVVCFNRVCSDWHPMSEKEKSIRAILDFKISFILYHTPRCIFCMVCAYLIEIIQQKTHLYDIFNADVVLKQIGLNPILFTSTFSIIRIIGWVVHIIKQRENHTIFRPKSKYVGDYYY
ncbi:citrate/2-methylcitrate synthase [Bacillus cereus]|uniref:citrate/2-methylcitrate synthase n=1 Tax=Bacillus cereus TaxID=1396 RepID=UPI00355AF4D9